MLITCCCHWKFIDWKIKRFHCSMISRMCKSTNWIRACIRVWRFIDRRFIIERIVDFKSRNNINRSRMSQYCFHEDQFSTSPLQVNGVIFNEFEIRIDTHRLINLTIATDNTAQPKTRFWTTFCVFSLCAFECLSDCFFRTGEGQKIGLRVGDHLLLSKASYQESALTLKLS